MSPRILVVDDDRQIVRLVQSYLQQSGFTVLTAYDGEEALHAMRREKPDLVVLDLMLPKRNGLEITRILRSDESLAAMPILMLTARFEDLDKILGLELGADDYLTKPFSIDVLLARLRAVSRRGAVPRPVWLEIGSVRLDPASHSVTRAGEVVNLTPREYKLLELLLRNRGRAVSRDAILQAVWGFDHEVSENNVEVFVRQLRLKVDTDEPKLIHTVRGFGYIMREP